MKMKLKLSKMAIETKKFQLKEEKKLKQKL